MALDSTKKVLAKGFSIADAIAEALDDKKVSFGESLELGAKLLGLVGMFKHMINIPAEFKDFTKEEQDDLIQFFVSEFDIPNDKAEEIVEKTFKGIVQLLGNAIEVYKTVKA